MELLGGIYILRCHILILETTFIQSSQSFWKSYKVNARLGSQINQINMLAPPLHNIFLCQCHHRKIKIHFKPINRMTIKYKYCNKIKDFDFIHHDINHLKSILFDVFILFVVENWINTLVICLQFLIFYIHCILLAFDECNKIIVINI